MEQEPPITKYVIAFLLFIIVVMFLLNKNFFFARFSTPINQPLKSAERITAGKKDFKIYSIQVPKGWTVAKSKSSEKSDILTITKDSYKIEIYQDNNIERLNCNVIIAANPNVLGESTEAPYKKIKGENGSEYIRSIIPPNPNAQKTSNTICQKTAEGFTLPTTFGVIEYETPIDASDVVMKEMDSMVQSLR